MPIETIGPVPHHIRALASVKLKIFYSGSSVVYNHNGWMAISVNEGYGLIQVIRNNKSKWILADRQAIKRICG